MSGLIAWMRARSAAMSVRERRLLAVAAVVVAGALMAVTVEWAVRERSRLDRALPQAQAQLLQMQDDAAELAQLSRAQQALALPDPAALGPALETAARVRGLAVTLQPVAGGMQVSGSGRFAALVEWLAAVQADSRLRPQRMTVRSHGDDVRFELVL